MSATDASATSETEPYEMRITQHGKMNAWVEFALNFLQQNPERPLTLHTLPAPPKQKSSEENTGENAEAELEQKEPPPAKPDRMPPPISTIPRLISVVEIIKREYLKVMPADEAHRGSLTGLHQYNELGTLPDDSNGEAEDPEAERLQSLSIALKGRKHLKMRHVAYMKITLSRKCLPELREKGASYQEPALRRLSNSARNRSRRRQKSKHSPTEAMDS